MFCTKCGKQLYDGDNFCAHCGTKVREELLFKSEQTSSPRKVKYDDIIFNPPFKSEAERRTQHITEEVNPYSSEPKKETVNLDWNLDGFPSSGRKKDESFEINWDAVIEKKKTSREVNVEKIEPLFVVPEVKEEAKVEAEIELEAQPKPEKPATDLFKTEEEETPLSIEELEKALFGTEEFESPKEDDPSLTIEYKAFKEKEAQKEAEKFYTYNSQKDAFQELIDRERARIEALENERKSQWKEITPDEPIKEYVPKKALEFEEVFQEPKTPLVPPLREVAVALPPLTARVMAEDNIEPQVEAVVTSEAEVPEVQYEVVLPPLTARVVVTEDEVEKEVETFPFLEKESEAGTELEQTEEKEDTAESKAEEKTKLRYSDIFPADAFSAVGGNESGESAEEKIDIDDEEDAEKGGNKFIKALIVFLAIIVIAEIGIIGVKFLAPESKAALVIDDLMDKVMAVFTEEEEEPETPVVVVEENVIEKYVDQLKSGVTNIGSVVYDSELKYDLSEAYAFEGIATSSEFKDVAWDGDEEKTNGYLTVKAVIAYYDSWKAENSDSEFVGINQVKIGEVRTGASGYYVLNKVIYAESEGDVLEKLETVYLESSENEIIVKEVKEETN